VAIKVPALFGLQLGGGDEPFYARNASLFVLPPLTVYFAWKRGLAIVTWIWLALSFAAAAVFANAFPFGTGSDTGALTALHLPIALWLVSAPQAGDAGRQRRVQDFRRFRRAHHLRGSRRRGVLTAFTMMMLTHRYRRRGQPRAG
jgi:hypothetical protein